MKKTAYLLALSILCLLASCTPRTSTAPPASEIVYTGPINQVFATIVRTITISQPIEGSNGWIITQSDRAGGFISAETSVRRYRLGAGLVNDREGVSLVITPNGPQATAVLTQSTPGGTTLSSAIRQALTDRFGEPIESGDRSASE